MRIKKLELIGFKSFKDRTVIQFDAGITGVVGPNGCGKSNIVDALCWVMGEMSAKHLRGSSMEDVIFAGSDGYAPVGMAEVSLTLENDGGPFPVKYLNHSEIMVTRRLDRSGESGYYINKEPARLRDVQEIFMDTGAGSKGFSIVAQGMISQIITQKPEERRSLIEEAAGITKFKVRRKESLRKLAATEQNLLRLNDIISELKRQIDSLQRQAQRAERYRNLKNQIEELDLWLSSKEYLAIKESLESLQNSLREISDDEQQGQSKISESEATVEEWRTELAALETLIQQRQSLHAELEQKSRDVDIQIRELKFELDQAHRDEERNETLLQEYRTRLSLQSTDLTESEEKLEALTLESARTEAECNEKSSRFADVQALIATLQDSLTERRRQMLTLSQSESATQSQIEMLGQQVEEIDERVQSETMALEDMASKKTDFEKRRRKIADEIEESKQLQLELSQDLETQQVERERLIERVAENRINVDEFKDNLNQVQSKLAGLEQLQSSMEGFNDGVKQVINWQKKQVEQHADGSESVYFEPMAEVVEVPAEFEVAMEAVMGTRMQVLLSHDSERPLEALDYLKTSEGGRSSFLSESWLDESDAKAGAPAGEGLVAVLREKINVPERFSSVADRMLGKIAVVDSVRSALKFRADHRDWAFVTLDGDVLETDGVLSGGTASDSGLLKRKRQIKDLVQEKQEWSGKLALATASLEKLEKQLENLTQNWEEAKKKNLEQEIHLAEIKKDLERADTEVQSAVRAFDSQRGRLDAVQVERQKTQGRQEELEAALLDLRQRREAAESEIGEMDAELIDKQKGIESRQTEVTNLQVETAKLKQELIGRQQQYETLKNSVDETHEQISRLEKLNEEQGHSLSSNQVLIEEKKVELEKLFTEIEKVRGELSQHRDKFEVKSAEMRELESKMQELYRKKNDWQLKSNELQLKIDQDEMKQKYLVEQMEERYQLSLSERAAELGEKDGDEKSAKRELQDLKQKLSRIGEVNLSAIEEYDETQERYGFLKKQQEDLIGAQSQLNRVIERIDKICTHRFRSTFELVNERFTRVFPVLFGGGEAQLMLTQQEGKEDGIDIIAKPPGKKMQNVTLMSGGEKALTAVSLIFSIFLVKPSPYCLLDEVDAPLDDANVARFNELVSEMAKRSQIILVTHNKYTMEITKKLYGVTMQEKGVSKMVSVSLEDARKVVAS